MIKTEGSGHRTQFLTVETRQVRRSVSRRSETPMKVKGSPVQQAKDDSGVTSTQPRSPLCDMRSDNVSGVGHIGLDEAWH